MDWFIILLLVFGTATGYIGFVRNFWVYRMRTKVGDHVYVTRMDLINKGDWDGYDAAPDYDDYASYDEMLWRFWDWNGDIEHWRRRDR